MTTLSGVYDRSVAEEAENYTQHLFRAGAVLQSAEMNEVQAYARYNLKQVADSLLTDGDIIRDAAAVVDSATGIATMGSGAVYLQGTVRGVPSATLTVPLTGTIVIGIYLIENTITEVEDVTLLDPAKETRSYQEPGAARLQVNPVWGYQGDGNTSTEFYPIYYVDDGELRAKESPPVLDSVSQAIATYDRDSAGTSYVVSGLTVTEMDDDATGNQVYTISAGRARINGFGVTLSAARRQVYAATPDLRYITNEPHASTTAAAQTITLNRTPINVITQVSITQEKTVSLVHGTYSGAQDPLPDSSIISISLVQQGATTYAAGTDYNLTGAKVDWSPSGAEPAPGSTYSVTYQYITNVTPTAVDDTSFSVTGAVPGTLILTDYSCKLPRIDRLCMDQTGAFLWIVGIATDYNPVQPQVPTAMLALAQISQTWTDSRAVTNDGIRMTSMSDLETISNRLDVLTDLIAQQELKSDASTRDAAAQKGVFVDAFINDDYRDQGLTQTAAIVGGALTLPIIGSASPVSTDITAVQTCNFTLTAALSQTLMTGSMNINPYLAFGIVAAKVTLTPNVDRWTETVTSWTSAKTEQFTVWATFGTHRQGSIQAVTVTTSTVLASSNSSLLQYLRQIDVNFEIDGFGPGEILTSATFDGISVTASTQ